MPEYNEYGFYTLSESVPYEGTFAIEVFECYSCGSVVKDKEAHDKFHEALAKLFESVQDSNPLVN